jgi:serine/threonine-protein kinase SRPK3
LAKKVAKDTAMGLQNYMPPEIFFESRCAQASDIWMLECVIYEVRIGLSIFDLAWSMRDEDLIIHMVEMLGRSPVPWRSALKHRVQWFHDNGQPRSEDEQMSSTGIGRGTFSLAVAKTLHAKLYLTDTHQPSDVDEGPVCEPPGVRRMEEAEVDLLGNLLGKMLKYMPDHRITIEEFIEHPWFTCPL